jgi:hypothetical protein
VGYSTPKIKRILGTVSRVIKKKKEGQGCYAQGVFIVGGEGG